MLGEPAWDLRHLGSVQTSAPGQLCHKAMAVPSAQAPTAEVGCARSPQTRPSASPRSPETRAMLFETPGGFCFWPVSPGGLAARLRKRAIFTLLGFCHEHPFELHL